MAETTSWETTPQAIAKRELRELIRNPPLRAEDAEAVLLALASGMRITAIGETPGLPPYWLINLWRTQCPDFDELCVQASEAGADALSWGNIAIADDDKRTPANKALSIAVRERMAKVLHRKKYDPAVKVEVSQAAGRADDLSDSELAAMVRARSRDAAVDAEVGNG
jgi:hypothetical protein